MDNLSNLYQFVCLVEVFLHYVTNSRNWLEWIISLNCFCQFKFCLDDNRAMKGKEEKKMKAKNRRCR